MPEPGTVEKPPCFAGKSNCLRWQNQKKCFWHYTAGGMGVRSCSPIRMRKAGVCFWVRIRAAFPASVFRAGIRKNHGKTCWQAGFPAKVTDRSSENIPYRFPFPVHGTEVKPKALRYFWGARIWNPQKAGRRKAFRILRCESLIWINRWYFSKTGHRLDKRKIRRQLLQH